MKFSLIAVAFLAVVSGHKHQHKKDTLKVWELKSVKAHRDEQALMKGYGDVSAADANKRHPLRSNGVNWTGKY